MIVRVDAGSPVPPYEQIRSQVATMIASGVLRPGTRLPSIRQLAGDLGLAVGTVARAYRELEQSGLIGGRGRNGTSVRSLPIESEPPDRERELLEAARAFALQARQLGVNPDQALASAERALGSMDAD